MSIDNEVNITYKFQIGDELVGGRERIHLDYRDISDILNELKENADIFVDSKTPEVCVNIQSKPKATEFYCCYKVLEDEISPEILEEDIGSECLKRFSIKTKIEDKEGILIFLEIGVEHYSEYFGYFRPRKQEAIYFTISFAGNYKQKGIIDKAYDIINKVYPVDEKKARKRRKIGDARLTQARRGFIKDLQRINKEWEEERER